MAERPSDDFTTPPISHLSSLECLDLSNNNLSVVPKGLPRSLVLLHLEKNSISSIPGDALTPIRNLEYLLLHNNKLRSRSIHPAAFQVPYLPLTTMQYTIVSEYYCSILVFVKHAITPLRITMCSWMNHDLTSLQGLKKLHTLHMYNNLLERVPRGLPRRAKTLMLLHNIISEIGRNDLVMLYTLTELNLSYNRLTSSKVHREAFRKLRLLETLDLSGNELHALPLGLPRSLQVLKVKDNQLNSIPEGALSNMVKLREINLSYNHLKLNSIYQGAWLELSALTVRVREVMLVGLYTFSV